MSTYHGEPLKDKDGQYIMGYWQPIISLEDREKALLMLEKRRMTQRREGRRRWILTGPLRCAECGNPLYGKLGTGEAPTDAYSCTAGRGHNAIQAARLEDYIQRSLAQRLLEKIENGEAEELREAEPTPWPLEDRLTEVGEKITELMEAYRADVLPASVVFDQVAKLEAEKKTLNRQRDAHYAVQTKPDPILRRTKDLLEWAEELMLQAPRRRESQELPDWMNQPWGYEAVERAGEEVDAETFGAEEQIDPRTDEKLLALRQELGYAVIKKGKRGGCSWKEEAFQARIELVWND